MQKKQTQNLYEWDRWICSWNTSLVVCKLHTKDDQGQSQGVWCASSAASTVLCGRLWGFVSVICSFFLITIHCPWETPKATSREQRGGQDMKSHPHNMSGNNLPKPPTTRYDVLSYGFIPSPDRASKQASKQASEWVSPQMLTHCILLYVSQTKDD
jgi:hypothetical protein